MKRYIICIAALAVLTLAAGAAYAAEHGGMEHGGMSGMSEHAGQEHGGKAISEPSSADIHGAMGDYIAEHVKQHGSLEVYDDKANITRKLSLVRIHERVGKTGSYYYSCADFRDTQTGEMLDLDLDVENKNGKLQVVEVRIHKVDGKQRYTYDQNDNRIPIEE